MTYIICFVGLGSKTLKDATMLSDIIMDPNQSYLINYEIIGFEVLEKDLKNHRHLVLRPQQPNHMNIIDEGTLTVYKQTNAPGSIKCKLPSLPEVHGENV